jgi:site-specific DNA-methyltransferase (adenine-specific)
MRFDATCEDNMTLMARYPDNYFDLAIVDPPYGDGTIKGRNTTLDKNWNFKPDKEYFTELFRVSKNQIVWGGNYFDLPINKHFVIWDKKQFMNNQFARCEYAWSSLRYNANIFQCFYNSDHRMHPTQKPVKLYQWLLQNYAKPGDKILDTHLGSMSIAIACHKEGFDLTGCEIDREYYDAGMKRLEQAMAQQELF